MILNLTSTGTGRFFIICTNSAWHEIGRYFCGLHFCNSISLLTFLQQNQSSWQRRKLKGIKTCAIHTLDIELVIYIYDFWRPWTRNDGQLCTSLPESQLGRVRYHTCAGDKRNFSKTWLLIKIPKPLITKQRISSCRFLLNTNDT